MPHDHTHILKKVREGLPGDTLLSDLSDLFKLFADTTRMKILFSLLETELCVCAISDLVGMEQSAVSHQLKKLKSANLVHARRQGKTVYYSLADEHVHSLVFVGFEHLMEKKGGHSHEP